MEIKGILKSKSPTQVVNEKFSKRDFVLTTEADGKYPQHISFQCTQDKCSLLDKFNEGQQLTVFFNLRGREWSGPNGIKYFNTIEAWRIERQSSSATPSAPSFNPDDSDLPF